MVMVVMAAPLGAQLDDSNRVSIEGMGAGVSVEFLLAEFTSTEKSVLVLLVQGYPPRQIARQLTLSKDYVYTLLRRLRAAFHTQTNAGLVTCALASGLLIVSEGSVRWKEAL
ncbi:MAG: LuxR C-terminal-related transcriptional regulator [Aggregatilineales bacterium]